MRWRARSSPRKWDLASSGERRKISVSEVMAVMKLAANRRVRTAAASASRASERMRSTMARRPLERCGVRCSRKPNSSNTAIASVDKDLLRRVAGIQRQQDRDQPAHDMRIAVAEIIQHGLVAVAAVDLLGEPDLAGAALHLVGGGMLGFRHRIQRAAEFDDVPVAVVPVVQQRKIIPDFVDRHHVPRSIPWPYIGPQAIESDIIERKMAPVSGSIAATAATLPLRQQIVRCQGVARRDFGRRGSAFSTPPIEPVWSGERLSVMI